MTTLKEHIECAAHLGSAGMRPQDVHRFMKLCREYGNLCVTACNMQLTPRQEVRMIKLDLKIKALAQGATQYEGPTSEGPGVEVQTQGDPRGYTVKLRGKGLPGNDMGGEGWFGVAGS